MNKAGLPYCWRPAFVWLSQGVNGVFFLFGHIGGSPDHRCPLVAGGMTVHPSLLPLFVLNNPKVADFSSAGRGSQIFPSGKILPNGCFSVYFAEKVLTQIQLFYILYTSCGANVAPRERPYGQFPLSRHFNEFVIMRPGSCR